MAEAPRTINEMEDGEPYAERLKVKPYEEELRALQIELLKLQHTIRDDGRRIVILFEGRDAAG